MSDNDFTKLYRNITKSTVWVGQARHVKLAWVTILAEADSLGRVTTPLPSLAKLAEITIEELQEALAIFLAPDPHSRSKELEGRRLVPLDDDDEYSGFRLVTYLKRRANRDPETRKRQNREAQERYRNRNKGLGPSSLNETDTLGPETESDRPTLEPATGGGSDPELAYPVDDTTAGKALESGLVSRSVSHVSQNKPIPSTSLSSSLSSTDGNPDPPDRSELASLAERYLADECSERLELGPANDWPEVRRVLGAWREAWGREVRIRGGLRDQRLRVILQRLTEGFSSAELCEAIRGARHDGFTTENRNAGQLESVLGSPNRVDKFREFLAEPPTATGAGSGPSPEDLDL